MRESRTPPMGSKMMHHVGKLVQVVRRGSRWSVEPVKFCRDCGELLRSDQEIKDGQCWECWFTDDADEEDCEE